jgi:hypothetical protein
MMSEGIKSDQSLERVSNNSKGFDNYLIEIKKEFGNGHALSHNKRLENAVAQYDICLEMLEHTNYEN